MIANKMRDMEMDNKMKANNKMKDMEMDLLKNAEFKEAFDEFDQVRWGSGFLETTIKDQKFDDHSCHEDYHYQYQYQYQGWQWIDIRWRAA